MMRNFIIVCDEKHREYGDYLSQLISMNDDTEEKIVGIKDGTVAAQVWLEKDYKANSATISSNQHILFIGDSKLINEKRSHMKNAFSNFGISYDWLGRQAALTVGKVIPLDKYKDFIAFAQSYGQNIEQLVSKNTKKTDVFAVLAGLTFAPLTGLEAAIPVAKKLTLNSKIKKQMYSFAIMKFYLDDLSNFLGLKSDEE